MAKLIYGAITSLDGFVEDESGKFEWAAPDEEVHSFVNDEERSIGTYLYGRKMYETMVFWETALAADGEPPCFQDFARIWMAADKIVFSKSLQSVSSAKTQIERDFNPDSIRQLKEQSDRDITIGGPALAAQAIGAGLVDEIYLLIAPILVGGGKPCLPNTVRLELELLDERGFESGMVYLRYSIK